MILSSSKDLAHEASGLGTWSRGTESIPVTIPGDLLAVLTLLIPPIQNYGQLQLIIAKNRSTER